MSVASLLKSEIPQYNLTLPFSEKDIKFRPYLVKEEKILLLAMEQGSEKAMLNAIKNLIESCVQDIKDAGDLFIGDLEYLFLHLRARSVGETVEPIVVCPISDKPVPIKIDLTTIKLNKKKPNNKTR